MNDQQVEVSAQHEPMHEQPDSGQHEQRRRSSRTQLIVFCALLFLAFIGMGVTQSMENGGWEYWLVLVVVYALVSISRAWRSAKKKGQPVWQMLRKQVFHWVGTLITFKVLFLLERTDIMEREAVSDVSLLVLALSCYLAGVHFEWMYLLVGIVLGIMAIALAYVEQYVVWIIMVPVAGCAVWLFLKRMKMSLSNEATTEGKPARTSTS